MRSSVPRGSRANAQATMFGMWKSPTLTASGSPRARKATSAAVRQRPQASIGVFERQQAALLQPGSVRSRVPDDFRSATLETDGVQIVVGDARQHLRLGRQQQAKSRDVVGRT